MATASNFSKNFESILAEVLYSRVSSLIPANQQHGFVKGRSTASNLCNSVHIISEALHNKNQIDVIFTDFAKAYDRVDHDVMLQIK